MPEQNQRIKSVKRKLNAITTEFSNKNVLLVDDSIVRGTTSKQIIEMARDAGAKRVYMASAAPPIKYPNVYGIDMPASHEFVAGGRGVEEIKKLIKDTIPDATIEIKDLMGDNNHYTATIKSKLFKNLSKILRTLSYKVITIQNS